MGADQEFSLIMKKSYTTKAEVIQFPMVIRKSSSKRTSFILFA